MKHNIHFVCRGNVYRSRTAEALFRKIGGKHVTVSSSGIETWRMNLVDPSYLLHGLLETATELGLSDYYSHARAQTTDELLAKADLIIFMDDDVYRDALMKFTFNSDKALVWHVADKEETAERLQMNLRSYQSKLRIFRLTTKRIQRLCEKLEHDVNHVSWTDIVDEQNEKRGFSLPLSIACKKGLWWRGCHVVATTPNGNYLVEKRSKTIVFAPGLIDITLGGGVDSGESPLAAAQREMQEEIGVTLPLERLKLIDTRKWDSYHPRYKTSSRIFLYTYRCTLDTDTPELKLQESEVAAVDILSPRQMSRLLRRHHLRHLGQLKSSYKYFESIVALSQSS